MALNDAYTDWHAAYLPTLKLHTPVEAAAWKRSRSDIPPPKAQVETDLVFPGIHLLELRKIRSTAGLTPPDP
jgi:hypothetical protein